jgi:hypothetical protein
MTPDPTETTRRPRAPRLKTALVWLGLILLAAAPIPWW